MLELRDITSGYVNTRIIEGLSLKIDAGEVVGLLGRNGVGKTTLLKTIFGLCRRFSGEVAVDGAPIPPGRPELLARAGVSLMPDDRGVFPTLTIGENLRLATRRGYEPAVDVHALYPLLTERSGQSCGTLSGGEKQQVGLARALLAGERLLAVDEFSQGLQPSVIDVSTDALRQVADTGVTVLIVEQVPEIALRFCDRIVVMVKGSIVMDRPAAELREDPTELTDLLVVS